MNSPPQSSVQKCRIDFSHFFSAVVESKAVPFHMLASVNPKHCCTPPDTAMSICMGVQHPEWLVDHQAISAAFAPMG